MKNKYLLSLLVALFVIEACEKDTPVDSKDSGPPSIVEVRGPSAVSPSESYVFQAVVTDPQGVGDVTHVLLSVFRSGETAAVTTDTLWDDGGYLHEDDGDEVARDGLFTQNVTWTFSGDAPEDFTLTFQARDKAGKSSETVDKEIVSLKNDPPAILSVGAPDTLQSGFLGEEYIWAEVVDSQGVENIESVTFRAMQGGSQAFSGSLFDDGTHGDATPADGRFTLGVEASYGAGRLGEYKLIFEATDLLGKKSAQVEFYMYIENDSPILSNLTVPDSVAKPLEGVELVLITVEVSDLQSLLDIKSVGFMSLKPDSTFANEGNPIPLVDNGLPFDRTIYQGYGDLVLGDGVYSFTLTVYSDQEAPNWDSEGTPIQTGTYVFNFQAEDRVGNKSDAIEKEFKIY